MRFAEYRDNATRHFISQVARRVGDGATNFPLVECCGYSFLQNFNCEALADMLAGVSHPPLKDPRRHRAQLRKNAKLSGIVFCLIA
jgi:hypothetical protein